MAKDAKTIREELRWSTPCPPRWASRRWRIFCMSCSLTSGRRYRGQFCPCRGTFSLLLRWDCSSAGASRPKSRGMAAGGRFCARWRCSSRWCCTGSGISVLPSGGRGQLSCFTALWSLFLSRRTAACAEPHRRTHICERRVFEIAEQKPGGSRCSPPGFCIIIVPSDGRATE